MARSIRRTQIALARRRQRPGTGSPLPFVFERTARMQWPDLTDVLGDLPWCVVDAVATRHYMPERSTADLDAAVLAPQAPAARQRLADAGYTLTGQLSIGGSSWRTPAGQIVDVLELRDPWAAEALAHAQGNRDRQGLPIIPLPYLTIMKLDASRHQDLADLARMLGQASEPQLAEVRRAVAAWRPSDVEDLEALIASGRWELGIP